METEEYSGCGQDSESRSNDGNEGMKTSRFLERRIINANKLGSENGLFGQYWASPPLLSQHGRLLERTFLNLMRLAGVDDR